MNLYLFNPDARGGKARKLEAKIKHYLSELGASGEFRVLTKKGDAIKAAKDGLKDKVDNIVAIGGDGLISQILPALAHQKVNLGIIPTGENNLLAQILGIKSWQIGCESLMKPDILEIDLGKIDDRYFTSTVEIDTKEAKVRKVLRFFKLRPKAQHIPTMINVKSEHSKLKFQSEVSSISINTVPIRKKMDSQEEINSGVFHIFIKSKPIKNGKKRRKPDELTTLQGSQIDIDAKTPLYVKVDGEPCGRTPIKIKIDPQALRVITLKKEAPTTSEENVA